MSSNGSRKKREEEKNSALIREIAALPENRQCNECYQRGPTYVNVTEGSFCCTQCSGILRGLNPPMRVKSISMATFTSDEIEKLRKLGNAENAKTWLGLYSGTLPSSSNKEALCDFLRKKYEKRQWYVSRAEMQQQEALMNEAKGAVGSKPQLGAAAKKPPDLDLFSLDVFSSPSATGAASSSSSHSRPIDLDSVVPHSHQQGETFSPPHFHAPPPPFPACAPNALTEASRQQKAQISQQNRPPIDLFTSEPTPSSRDPFSPVSAPFAASSNKAADNLFASFDDQFSGLSLKNSSTFTAFPPTNNGQTALPKSVSISNSVAITTASDPFPSLQPTQSATFSTPAAIMQPAAMSVAPQPSASLPTNDSASAQSTAPTAAASTGVDYNALAELDQLFNQSGSSSTNHSSWIPSGFSTGVPPTSQPGKSLPTCMPKSSTMGAIASFNSSNPFQTPPIQLPSFANSQANLSSNAFGAPLQPSSVTYPAGFPPAAGSIPTNGQPFSAFPSSAFPPAKPSAYSNPFAPVSTFPESSTYQPQQQPFFPSQSVAVPPNNAAFGLNQSGSNPNQKWNPFL